MEDHTDSIEFNRSNGTKVRIVFEMYKTEILYHHYEYRHNDKSEWKSMGGNDSEQFTYSVSDDNGVVSEYTINYPTEIELKKAQEIISQRYYFWSI